MPDAQIDQHLISEPKAEHQVDWLLQQASLAPTRSHSSWPYLEAAHITGQTVMRLHMQTHLAMLAQALRQLDLREAAGQILRLMLVPIGHATRRLPPGNTGRARISAFAPMPISQNHRSLIEQAQARP